jgi:predicted outer membrane repeat protein
MARSEHHSHVCKTRLRDTDRKSRFRCRRRARRRSLGCEPLEDRRVLAVITVDSAADDVTDDGLITLREAVLAANFDRVADAVEGSQAGDGVDTIRFAPSLERQSIVLSLGEILIAESVTIEGPGASQLEIDASGDSRIFQIVHHPTTNPLPNVELRGLTLTGGSERTSGAVILSAANLTLTQMELSGNDSSGSGEIIRITAGALTVDQSVIRDNDVGDRSGRLVHFNGGDLLILNSTFTDNIGDGFLAYSDGEVRIEDSTIRGNPDRDYDAFLVYSTGGTVAVSRSTISGWDTAFLIYSDSTVSFENSTISDNRRGIMQYKSGGDSTISQSTISGNDNGVDAFIEGGTLAITESTIVANRNGIDFRAQSVNTTAIVENSIVTNTDTDLTGSTVDVRWSIIGGDAMLGPLADNGGPTLTHLPLPGSPAIDAGDPAYPLTYPYDQRGAPRVGGTRVDIGAVETMAPTDAFYVVDTPVDESDGDYGQGDLSLREAIELANTSPGRATIAFAPDLAGGTIALARGPLAVTDSAAIVGPSAHRLTVQGGGEGRIFDIDDAQPDALIDVQVSGLTLAGGNAMGDGGAIRSTENLTVTDVEVVDSRATGGGGGIHVEVDENARVRIFNSTLSDNEATNGGGISAVSRGGAVDVIGSTISHNRATENGGGLHADGSGVSLEHTTVTGNIADADGMQSGSGGGIFAGHPVSLDHTIVAANEDRSGIAPDVHGPGDDAISARFSLIGTNVGAGLEEGRTGNLIGGPLTGTIDPRLGPLEDNGGNTRTHALLLDSPAVDTGDVSTSEPLYDQRGVGFRRQIGLAADIGSYELQDQILIVDQNADESDGDFSRWDLALREAIEISNLRPGKQTIAFDPVFDTIRIVLDQGEIAIRGAVDINPEFFDSAWPHVVVSASGSSRIFRIDDGDAGTLADVHIEEMQLIEGRSEDNGGAILSREQLWLYDVVFSQNTAGNDGGALAVEGGTTELHEVSFTENSASASGGAIHASQLASVAIHDGRLAGNQAGENGGGIAVDGGTLAIYETVMEENSAVGDGGALFGDLQQPNGGIMMRQSYVATNGADGQGGGLAINVAAETNVTLENTTVAGNTADGDGGGLALEMSAGSIEVKSSTFSGNTAGSDGGALCSRGIGGRVNLSLTTITDNESAAAGSGAGGGIATSLATVVYNTIVVGNRDMTDIAPDIAVENGGSLDARYVLLGDNRGSGLAEGLPDPLGNIVGGPLGGTVDPQLQPLAPAGGTGPVHLPAPGSPAIGAGDPDFAPPPETDQRGSRRVSGGRIDIGATEHITGNIADFNGDQRFDCGDLDLLSAAAFSAEPSAEFDLTGDGNVDVEDVHVWLALAGEEALDTANPFLMGDANLDGAVFSNDLGAIGINWQMTQFDGGFCWGDFNVDGRVDASDLNLLAINWQRVAGNPIVTPAPAAAAALEPQRSSQVLTSVSAESYRSTLSATQVTIASEIDTGDQPGARGPRARAAMPASAGTATTQDQPRPVPHRALRSSTGTLRDAGRRYHQHRQLRAVDRTFEQLGDDLDHALDSTATC